MQGQLQNSKYLELQGVIKAELLRAFKLKRIGLPELAAILFLLGLAETDDELKIFLDIFSNSFPVLASAKENERMIEKSDYEMKIREIAQLLVKKDPMKAAEFTKAAMMPGATLESLENDFPEIDYQKK
jgi:hypothetical protein